MSSKLYNYFGISDFSDEAKGFVSKFIGLSQLANFTTLLSSTFYVLFVIDLVDYVQAGVLISIGFIIQGIVDYPTGVLADWLSYRMVLIAAYVGHSISFLALAFTPNIPEDQIFNFLVFVYCLEAFSLAQESGALQSYFDNNYKAKVGELDPEKANYKEIYGKNLMFFRLLGGLSIYIGGFLSVGLNRPAVFLAQGIFSIILVILFTIYMKEPAKTENVKRKDYWKKLKSGFLLIFKSKALFFFSMAFILIMIVNRIWVSLLVFPIYFGYTGSDSLASLLRGTLFLLGSILTGFSTKASKKLKNEHLWAIFIVHAILIYGAYSLLLWIYPISLQQEDAEFNIIAISIIVLIASYANFSSGVLLTLSQKLMLDLIPDENRNSYYSLVPTLTLFIGSFFIISSSKFLSSTQNFSQTVFFFVFLPVIICSGLSYLSIKNLQEETD